MIKIFNDIFTEDIQNEILNKLRSPNWSFNGGGETSRFWHMDGLESDLFFSEYLFNEIQILIQRQVEIIRVYANGQTAGQSGLPHRDDGDLTFLYYPSVDMVGMGGNLLFLDENYEPTNVIGYQSNRGVFFPAKILHYAEAPSRFYNGLRISVAWKLKIQN